jgi:hypothetical protein
MPSVCAPPHVVEQAEYSHLQRIEFAIPERIVGLKELFWEVRHAARPLAGRRQLCSACSRGRLTWLSDESAALQSYICIR